MWLLLLGCGPSTLGEATRYDDIRRLVEDGALVGQTELTLVDRGLGPEIGELLLEHGRELEELDLTGNLVGTRGAVALAQLGALKELRLGPGRAYIDGNGLQDAGVAALVAGELDQLQVLARTRVAHGESVDLGGRRITTKERSDLKSPSGDDAIVTD